MTTSATIENIVQNFSEVVSLEDKSDKKTIAAMTPNTTVSQRNNFEKGIQVGRDEDCLEDDDDDDGLGVLSIQKVAEIVAIVHSSKLDVAPVKPKIRRSSSSQLHALRTPLPTVMERSRSFMAASVLPIRVDSSESNSPTTVSTSSSAIQQTSPERTNSSNSNSGRRLPPHRANSTDSALRAYRRDLQSRSSFSAISATGSSNNQSMQLAPVSSLRALHRHDNLMNNTSPVIYPSPFPMPGRTPVERASSSTSLLSAITMDSTGDWTMDSINLRKDQLIADPLLVDTPSAQGMKLVGGKSNHSYRYDEEDCSFACHDSISRFSGDFASTYSEHMPERPVEISTDFLRNKQSSPPRRRSSGGRLGQVSLLNQQRRQDDYETSETDGCDLSFFDNSFSTLESGDLDEEGSDLFNENDDMLHTETEDDDGDNFDNMQAAVDVD